LVSLIYFNENFNKFFLGTFAVISLMIAQAIEGVINPSMNLINHNQTFFSFSNESHSFILNEKISIATTLALLVGLVQVSFDNC